MMVFFKIWPQNIKKAVITLQALIFKLIKLIKLIKVMMIFFKIWPQNIKKAIITLQAWIFKLNDPNQTCISSKSIKQLTKTIFFDSAIFFEKKKVKNRLWAKSEFLWAKRNPSLLVSLGLDGIIVFIRDEKVAQAVESLQNCPPD